MRFDKKFPFVLVLTLLLLGGYFFISLSAAQTAGTLTVTSPQGTVSNTFTARARSQNLSEQTKIRFEISGPSSGGTFDSLAKQSNADGTFDYTTNFCFSSGCANATTISHFFPNGNYTIKAKTVDGTVISTTVSFTIGTPPASPSLTITSPAAGSTVSGQVTLKASGQNMPSDPYIVDFFTCPQSQSCASTRASQSGSGSQSFSATYETRSLNIEGPYTVYARAQRNVSPFDVFATSTPPVSFSVSNPPQILFTNINNLDTYSNLGDKTVKVKITNLRTASLSLRATQQSQISGTAGAGQQSLSFNCTTAGFDLECSSNTKFNYLSEAAIGRWKLEATTGSLNATIEVRVYPFSCTAQLSEPAAGAVLTDSAKFKATISPFPSKPTLSVVQFTARGPEERQFALPANSVNVAEGIANIMEWVDGGYELSAAGVCTYSMTDGVKSTQTFSSQKINITVKNTKPAPPSTGEKPPSTPVEQPSAPGAPAPEVTYPVINPDDEKLAVNTALTVENIVVDPQKTISGKNQVTFIGKGPANTKLKLLIYSDPLEREIETDENGDWQHTEELDEGGHTAYITYEDEKTQDESRSEIRDFFVGEVAAASDLPSGKLTRQASTPLSQAIRLGRVLAVIVVGLILAAIGVMLLRRHALFKKTSGE